jgi:hypothetical protein
MIKMKNILAENLLRFGVKNLNESDKKRLIEAEPGDPSQTIDLSAELSEITTALRTYNTAFKEITGVNIILFVDSNNVNNITANDLAANKFIVKLSDKGNMHRKTIIGEWGTYLNEPYPKISESKLFTLDQGALMGSDPNIGLWRFGTKKVKFPENQNKRDQFKQKIKAAATVAGEAIAKYYTALIAKTQGKPAEVVSTADGTVKIIA